MQQTSDNPQSKTHPRPSQCHCGRSFQEKPNSIHRVVPIPSDIQTDHSTLAMSSNRLICHQSKHKTPNLCVSHSRPTGLGGGYPEHFLEEHNWLRLSSDSTVTKRCPEIIVPRMQAHPDKARAGQQNRGFGIWWNCPLIIQDNFHQFACYSNNH